MIISGAAFLNYLKDCDRVVAGFSKSEVSSFLCVLGNFFENPYHELFKMRSRNFKLMIEKEIYHFNRKDGSKYH